MRYFYVSYVSFDGDNNISLGGFCTIVKSGINVKDWQLAAMSMHKNSKIASVLSFVEISKKDYLTNKEDKR